MYKASMPVSRAARATPRRKRRRINWRGLARSFHRARHTGVAAFLRAPPAGKIAIGAILVIALWSVVNLAYHVIRKPTEMFFPVSGTLTKPPAETWRQYAPLFRHYATASISPELLAALAQIESAGDPVARTYWRWRFSWNPLNLYQPASSAVGMYQMTDPAFAEAKRYCIHHHSVIEDGAWYDPSSCWLNALYTRVIPSHAVELTAIYLDRKVTRLIADRRNPPTPQQRQDLAALIHLCGAGPGENFVRRGFHLAPGEICSDHDAGAYLARINAAKRQFLRLAAAE